MLILVKLSLFGILLLIIFATYASQIKFIAGMLLILQMIFIHKSSLYNTAALSLGILGIIYIILVSRYFAQMEQKVIIPKLWRVLISSILCLTASYLFFRCEFVDPYQLAMLITGIYLFSNPTIQLDRLLAIIIFFQGIVFLRPQLVIISSFFLTLIALCALNNFPNHANNN